MANYTKRDERAAEQKASLAKARAIEDSPRPRPLLPVDQVIAIGNLWVNFPVVMLVVFGFLGFAFALGTPPLWPDTLIVGLAAGCCSIALALLWRSYYAPKWLLWAMATTDDRDAILSRASSVALVLDQRTAMNKFLRRMEIWTPRRRSIWVELGHRAREHHHKMDT